MPLTPEQRAQIARENGAKSKGPTSAKGKDQSKRNAIKHGQYATALKLLVPPHSAALLYEDRREFYKLFDTNIEKYQPMDDHERAIVREITDMQWSNIRVRLATHAAVNREIVNTAEQITPIAEENFCMENILAAYERLAPCKAFQHFHKEYGANLRNIATLERRLRIIQREWKAANPKLASCDGERQSAVINQQELESIMEPAEPKEGTHQDPPKPEENCENRPKGRVKIINVAAPLTDEKIRLYKQIYPKRDLQFNVYDPLDGAKNPKAA